MQKNMKKTFLGSLWMSTFREVGLTPILILEIVFYRNSLPSEIENFSLWKVQSPFF